MVPPGWQVGSLVASHPLPGGWASHTVVLQVGGAAVPPLPRPCPLPLVGSLWVQVHTGAGPDWSRPLLVVPARRYSCRPLLGAGVGAVLARSGVGGRLGAGVATARSDHAAVGMACVVGVAGGVLRGRGP